MTEPRPALDAAHWPPPPPPGAVPTPNPGGFAQPMGPPGAVSSPDPGGFAQPMGPPGGGVVPPAAIPPAPKAKRAWLPILGGALYVAFRIGLVVLNATADEEPGPQQQPFEALGPDVPAVQVPSSTCFDEAGAATACEDVHWGETVGIVELPRGHDSAEEAFYRCLDDVTQQFGALPIDTEVRAEVVTPPDSSGTSLATCNLQAVEGSDPLVGSFVD